MANVQSGFLNFLRNVKVKNYETLIDDLLKAYQTVGCNMSLKIHFLYSHLNFFHLNLGAVSYEHVDRFHHGEKICRKVVAKHVS
jgi:hypothetical protein